ncbi:MAG: acyltransferase [Clostridia bacterium]|nr:acyltransferase [Clostridia bacterium]
MDNSIRKYELMDYIKLLFALLIVCGHFTSENPTPTIIKLPFSISAIAVPFFFTCTGFLCGRSAITNNDSKTVVKRQIKKLFSIYFWWSLIYILFKVLYFIGNKVDSVEVFQYIYKCFVYTTYATIWYLPASAIGLLISWKCIELLSVKKALFISLFFYLICIFGYSYSFILKGTVLEVFYSNYETVFISVRNCLFYAFPFITLGWFIAERQHKGITTSFVYFKAFICILLFICEALLLKKIGNTRGSETLIMHLLTSYYLVVMSIQSKIKTPENFSVYARKMSTLVFLSQRIFLTGIPAIIPFIYNNLFSKWYLGLLCVLICTVSLSMIILLLSKRFTFLKRLF